MTLKRDIIVVRTNRFWYDNGMFWYGNCCYETVKNYLEKCKNSAYEFFKKASEGDAQCVKVLNEYLDNLTTGINNLYIIFDRDIVIGGFVSRYLLEYEENIRQRLIDKYSFDTDGRYFSISSCTSERTDTGAAIMFLSEFINSI